ncbi:cation:proton antiporter [Kiritimatiella glycovorans]|uniref:K(+)/H(+) antiporter YhaU n=1 Tax=Kiritimatiella glycovorans TaxID=1307763 RepID=A0A0G3EHH4_9BACT|nr:cation:proton antiporter [Kiritimatiella glycovorans]AKJ63629.1 K(+)/H(+) antiporter YhaU [Kiritimatiella glycovorans]
MKVLAQANSWMLAMETPMATGIMEDMMVLVLQLGLIVIAAKLGGYLFQRVLRLPEVLGELAAGMLIGPYALGHLIMLPQHGALFAAPTATMPVSTELYGIATVASIVLLFRSGLETDLSTFMQYAGVGTLVGLGGLIFSFGLGAGCAVWFGVADSWMDPGALFLGAISTATSVGISARILTEKRKIASPEGVTILAGAVLDDVLGIIILAIVVGMTRVARVGGEMSWMAIGWVAVKAMGFWLICTALGLLLARRIGSALKQFRSTEIMVTLAFGLALLVAGLFEMAGLAMIIGAYIMGLTLSRTDLAHELQTQLNGIYRILVPVFFCVMGMLVDFEAMHSLLGFGLVYSLLAVAAKVLGCGIPAWCSRFNWRGALRVGFGMLPRGEVALIVAGIGLSTGAIGPQIFGASVLMTLITTIIAPPALIESFKGPKGVRREIPHTQHEAETIELDFPSPDISDFLCDRFLRSLRREEFFVHRLPTEKLTYQARKEDAAFTITVDGPKLIVNTTAEQRYVARMMLLEEVLSLSDLLEASRQLKSLNDMGNELVDGLF